MTHLLCLLFLLSLFFIVAAQSTYFPNCPLYKCGDFNIRYPFWKMDNESTTRFCGYPDFGIRCINNMEPKFTLDDHPYDVRVIDSGSIVIADSDLSPGSTECPTVRHNISLGTLPLEFSMSTVNLTFHFNCTGSPSFATGISCLEGNAYVNFMNNNSTEESEWDEYTCEEEVVTRVFHNTKSINLWDDFVDLLRRGFRLEWRRTDDCDKCEKSDGLCGHRGTTEFICFCPGGPISNDYCKGNGNNLGLKLGIGFGSAGFVFLVMIALFCFWRQRNNKKRYYGSSYRSRNISSHTSSMTDPEKNGAYHGVQIFKYGELEKATNHFDSRNELGDGGFGTVYQGKLKDGRVVAVKRLYENNYKRVEQFMNEVGILAHLRHRNLVSLYGCTTHHSRELLLVYEYIPNGTIADHLHGEKAKPGSLTWPTRMCIAIETASALVYLHASDVVHRDVKTNNILLDNNFNVKVADFGLSRLFPNNVTHVSTAPQGTPGYVDPEYHECYQLTNKSDVYSFGVVLVELISSKPAVDITRHRHEINLSSMALNKIQNDALHELVDPHLGYESEYEVRKMINAVAEVAFQCLQNDRECRPSMDEVLESLVSIQNGMGSKEKQDVMDDDAVLLKNYPQGSPDSVAVAWSNSTTSLSSG